MLTITELTVLLFAHWVADFLLQTDYQAKNKSTDFTVLISHTFTYSLAFTFICSGLLTSLGYDYPTLFYPQLFAITFVTHTQIDFITSKITKKLWEEGDTHNFFVVIGFDQLLHLITLILYFSYFMK
jgi:hypothetical protein